MTFGITLTPFYNAIEAYATTTTTGANSVGFNASFGKPLDPG